MKLSVFYDHILKAHEQTGKSVPEILKLCHSCGIDGVEVDYDAFEKNGDEICAMLADAQMRISCFCRFFEFQNNGDLSGAKKMLETAADLNVGRVLIIPGFLNAPDAAELSACSGLYETTARFMDGHPGVQNMKGALVALTEYAAARGVAVTLEDFDGFAQPFARMNQLLWFMKNVPGLRFTLDMGNFAFSDENVIQAAALLKDYIVHVHCKDRAVNPAVCGTFCKGLGASPVGSGYIPIRELIAVLRDISYDGYLVIEHFGAPDQLSFIRQSAAFLRSCMES